MYSSRKPRKHTLIDDIRKEAQTKVTCEEIVEKRRNMKVWEKRWTKNKAYNRYIPSSALVGTMLLIT